MKKTGCRMRLLAVLLVLMVVLMTIFAGCGKKNADPATTGTGTVQTEVLSAGNEDDTTVADSASAGDPESVDPESTVVEPENVDPESSAAGSESTVLIDEDGSYTSKEDVALYIDTYHKLPQNFITKKEAKALGWSGGSLEPYAEGKCIGGDRFGNYEGLLPEGETYYECDIDTLGADKRGAKRIIYTDDGEVYYTEDHYASFVQLY